MLNNNLVRPSVLYIGGFWVCALVALLMKKEWGIEKICLTTVYYFVGGALLFFLVEWHDYYRFKNQTNKSIDFDDNSKFRVISTKKLIVFWIFQLFAYLFMAKAKMDYAGTSDISDTLIEINDATKFEGTLVQLPFYINLPYNIATYAGFIWCALLPLYQFKSSRYNKQKKWLLINFITVFFGCFLSGGRQMFLVYIVAYLSFYYMCYRIQVGWKGGAIPKKMFIVLLLISTLFVSSFLSLGVAQGREDYSSSGKDIAALVLTMYCGAELKNLDDYLQKPYKQGNESDLPAQYTFNMAYNTIAQRLGSTKKYGPHTPFNDYNGYPLGNVYTTYYDYFIDFGYAGILLCVLMGYIYAVMYRKVLISEFWETGKVDMWVLFYANFAVCPLLSFFSNQFFGSIVLSYLIRNFLLWWFLLLFFFGSQTPVYKKVKAYNTIKNG